MDKIEKPAGKEGEETAVKLLEDACYKILETNYRFGKQGEIDIIARDPEGYLVFTEVKLRHNLNYGEPEYAITKSKQNRIKRLASAYLFEKEITDSPCRFDVICILQYPGEEPQIKHYIDAFR